MGILNFLWEYSYEYHKSELFLFPTGGNYYAGGKNRSLRDTGILKERGVFPWKHRGKKDMCTKKRERERERLFPFCRVWLNFLWVVLPFFKILFFLLYHVFFWTMNLQGSRFFFWLYFQFHIAISFSTVGKKSPTNWNVHKMHNEMILL